MEAHRSAKTQIYATWEEKARPAYATGVSLHGHTWESHENLGFLPSAIKKTHVLPYLMRILERRYRRKWNDDIDYNRGYWTSPISPDTAYFIESRQIRNEGMEPIVSITDHDEIAACIGRGIVSLEWTAPYEAAIFHIGIHNIPADRAASLLGRLRAITAVPSGGDAVRDILDEIAADPGALIVLNHPFVDQGRIGHSMHGSTVRKFLERHRPVVHALEINALQPHAVNDRVKALGDEFGVPLVAGGDRHAFEPNGAINLTNAKTFGAFAREIRDEKRSAILLMPQYRERLAWRYTRNIEAIMEDYPVLGSRAYWHDRVFYECPDGVVRSLTEMTAGKDSAMARTTNGIVGIIELVNHLTATVEPPQRKKKKQEGK